MNLDTDKWKEFRFGNLIDKPYKAKAFNKDDLKFTGHGGLRYITRTGVNNGCEMIVSALEIPRKYVEKGNAISIGDTTATCFYQDEDFVTGDHMVVIRAKWLNRYNGLFIVGILKNEQYKYSYGRAFLIDRIQNTVIRLPIEYNVDGTPYIDPNYTYSEEGYVPDWQFMEEYIKSLRHKPLTTSNKSSDELPLDIENWKEFKVGNFFDIHPTKSLKDVTSSDCVEDGVTPLVVNQSYNNGVAGYVNYEPTEKGGVITFSDTWEGETFFYQHYDFIGLSHVQGMYPRYNMSEKVLIFMVTMLEFESKDRYSYGRKKRRELINKSYIKLPIQYNLDGTPFYDESKKYSDDGYIPDWQFMEDYIKSLPYGDRI